MYASKMDTNPNRETKAWILPDGTMTTTSPFVSDRIHYEADLEAAHLAAEKHRIADHVEGDCHCLAREIAPSDIWRKTKEESQSLTVSVKIPSRTSSRRAR